MPDVSKANVDARSRFVRTLLQGSVPVALLAASGAVYDAVSAGQTDYRLVALAAGQAVLSAVLAFVHRKVMPPKDAA